MLDECHGYFQQGIDKFSRPLASNKIPPQVGYIWVFTPFLTVLSDLVKVGAKPLPPKHCTVMLKFNCQGRMKYALVTYQILDFILIIFIKSLVVRQHQKNKTTPRFSCGIWIFKENIWQLNWWLYYDTWWFIPFGYSFVTRFMFNVLLTHNTLN